MGYHHILTIAEDAMLHEGSPRTDIDALVGAAVIDACFGSKAQNRHPAGCLLDDDKNARVLPADTVRHIHEHEVGDFAVFIWANGELRVSGALDDGGIDLAMKVLQAARVR